jgi:hypothetical protein
VAQGYPPRRPPVGPDGRRRNPDEPGGGRHGYPSEPDDGRGYPDQQDSRRRHAGEPARRHGYPEEGGRHGYPGERDDGRGHGDEPDDGRGYPDAGGGRHGYPDERGPAGGPERVARRRPGRIAPGRPGRVGPGGPERLGAGPPRQAADAFADEDEVMPWTGPGIYPVGPGRRERRPPPAEALEEREPGFEPGADEEQPGEPGEGGGQQLERRGGAGRGRRAAAARARKSRRRLILGGAVIVVAAVVVLAILGKLPFQGGPSTSTGSGVVTTYQPGEFRSVPSACQSVSAATLRLYLPGKVAEVSQSLGSTAQSQCTWTLDAGPNFRVLSVTSQAFAPSLLSSGNGSATSGATDAYNQLLRALRNPPKSSNQPKALLGSAVGLGDSAFSALQVYQLTGNVTDKVTVVARESNVVITVTMQAQESGGGFGPVPDTTLRAAALAAAHDTLAAFR